MSVIFLVNAGSEKTVNRFLNRARYADYGAGISSFLNKSKRTLQRNLVAIAEKDKLTKQADLMTEDNYGLKIAVKYLCAYKFLANSVEK